MRGVQGVRGVTRTGRIVSTFQPPFVNVDAHVSKLGQSTGNEVFGDVLDVRFSVPAPA